MVFEHDDLRFLREVVKVIENLKCGEPSGVGGVTASVLKYGEAETD